MKRRSFALLLLVVSLAIVPMGYEPANAEQSQTVGVELANQNGGSTLAVANQGTYLYFGIGPRLVIADMSNPSNPTVLGQTRILPEFVQGVAVAGNYAYIADGEGGLVILRLLLS